MSPEAEHQIPREPYKNWTVGATTVLQRAQQNATQDGSDSISLNHLVLSMLQEGQGLGYKILSNLIPKENLERFKESLSGQANKTAAPNSPNQDVKELSDEAKLAVALATDEASKLNHHYLGTEHLLLGILRYDQTEPIPVLRQFGITYEKVCEETQRILLAPTPYGMIAYDHRARLAFLRQQKDSRLTVLETLLGEGWNIFGRTIYEPDKEKRVLEIRGSNRIVMELIRGEMKGWEIFSLDGMAELRLQNPKYNPQQ